MDFLKIHGIQIFFMLLLLLLKMLGAIGSLILIKQAS